LTLVQGIYQTNKINKDSKLLELIGRFWEEKYRATGSSDFATLLNEPVALFK
jgi:hypothetical protein